MTHFSGTVLLKNKIIFQNMVLLKFRGQRKALSEKAAPSVSVLKRARWSYVADSVCMNRFKVYDHL